MTPIICRRCSRGIDGRANASPRLDHTHTFSYAEDVVYVGLGVLLASGAVVLLVSTGVSFAESLSNGTLYGNIVELLDRILLILLVVELLYTVQVSFREHTLLPEPFLLVGLIAAVRRVLVLTAEFGHINAQSGAFTAEAQSVTRFFIMELAVLTLLIIALAISLYFLRGRDETNVAHRG